MAHPVTGLLVLLALVPFCQASPDALGRPLGQQGLFQNDKVQPTPVLLQPASEEATATPAIPTAPAPAPVQVASDASAASAAASTTVLEVPAAPTPQQQGAADRRLLSSLFSQTRKLLQTWVGTDAPAFNAAAMGYYQGYPNRFRASNAASSFLASQQGSPDNFGAGQNPYMSPSTRRSRKLLQTWVGTDVPAFNAAAMGYYQGYPNRFRASNAASSFLSSQQGSPDNFGAGHNPYMAPGAGK